MRLRLKAAVVVVDMAEEDRRKIAWGRGSAEEGIMKLSSVISSAGSAGIPSILVTYKGHDRVLHELAEAAGPRSRRFVKSQMSAFTAAGFADCLESLKLDGLIIGGWVGHLCVRDTVIDAIRQEYMVYTTDDILFHRAGSPPYPMMDDSELRLYARLVTKYPDAASLAESLFGPNPFKPPAPITNPVI